MHEGQKKTHAVCLLATCCGGYIENSVDRSILCQQSSAVTVSFCTSNTVTNTSDIWLHVSEVVYG